MSSTDILQINNVEQAAIEACICNESFLNAILLQSGNENPLSPRSKQKLDLGKLGILPLDVLFAIFSFLPWSSFLRLSEVSKRFEKC